jgi:predicted metallo-beta-lactamase superfamily hydrolase
MKVIPLAADSLGVRSMATYVEVGRTSLLIDPGATLAPNRHGLPPAPEEWEALQRATDRIAAYALRAQFVFVSHYHEDHFRPDRILYAGRTVLAKNPHRMVEGQQARRAADLWKALADHAKLTSADNHVVLEPGLALEVSPPLPHGVEGSPLGSIVALTVVDEAERQRFVFASDVQGPMSAVARGWIVRQRPTLLYLAGPPSYMVHEVGEAAIEQGIANLLAIVQATGCRVIMDHHALRDHRYATRFERLFATGRVVTAAGHIGLADQPLEFRRAQLWGGVRRPGARAPEARAKMAGRSRLGAASQSAKGGHGA